MHRTCLWPALGAVCLWASVGAADDWACFQHDPQHTGRTPHELKLPFKMLWEKEIGWSTSQAIAVAGRLYLGRWQGDVLCLDQKRGDTLWTFATEGPVRFSAAVADGRIFIGSEDQHIYCLSTEGKLLWKHRTGGGIWSSPVVAEGRVFCGSKDGRLYALNSNDGTVAWSYDLGSVIWSSPAYHDGKVFCGAKLGRFVALEATSGRELWTFQTEGWLVNNSPTVAGGRVFIPTLNRGYLPESGEWHIWTQGEDGLKEVLAARKATASLYALDEQTGKVLWSFPTPEQALGSNGPTGYSQACTFPGDTAAIGGDCLYLNGLTYPFGDGLRRLAILDARTGALAAVSTDVATSMFADATTAANVLLGGNLCLLRGLAYSPDGSLLHGSPLGIAPGMERGDAFVRYAANLSCADGMVFAVGLVRHNAPAGMGYIRAFTTAGR
jgi:outer membrane protein assembly factor BamB